MPPLDSSVSVRSQLLGRKPAPAANSRRFIRPSDPRLQDHCFGTFADSAAGGCTGQRRRPRRIALKVRRIVNGRTASIVQRIEPSPGGLSLEVCPWRSGGVSPEVSRRSLLARSGSPRRFAFQAKPYSRVRSQISPNIRLVNFRCTSASSTVESVGYGFVVAVPLATGSLLASTTFLFVTSQHWRDAAGCYTDRASQASSPRFVASPQLPSPSRFILIDYIGMLSFVQVPFSYRGLDSQGKRHTTSSRLCRAYHATAPTVGLVLISTHLATAR